MSSKRKGDGSVELASGRQKKKQKTALARTIAVQPGQSSTSSALAQNAVAGPSRAVQFEGVFLRRILVARHTVLTLFSDLPSSIDVERFAEVLFPLGLLVY